MTPKQTLFAAEYLIDLNATQAAIRAGYSEKTAAEVGYENLRKPQIGKAIEEAMAARAEKTGIAAQDVLDELAKCGFTSLADVTDWGTKEVAIGYDADGKKLRAEDIGDAVVVHYLDAPFVKPVNRDDLPQEVRAAVAEVSLGKDGFKIKMHDKVGALTQIGRHLGMFKDKTEYSVSESLEALIAASMSAERG